MKHLFLILLSFILLSACGDDNITITKSEYNRLKGVKQILPEYPKRFKFQSGSEANRVFIWQIILGQDKHEYLESNFGSSGGNYVNMHYVDCKLCKSRLTDTLKCQ